jgi:hypothetical protein
MNGAELVLVCGEKQIPAMASNASRTDLVSTDAGAPGIGFFGTARSQPTTARSRMKWVAAAAVVHNGA